MTLRDALERLGGPVLGLTSLIDSVRSGNLDAVSGKAADSASTPAALFERATAEEARLQRGMDGATSDAVYWGYAGQHAYWRAVRMVAEAAVLTGGDLPDVAAPHLPGIVMDDMSALTQFGEDVLRRAKNYLDSQARAD